MPGFDRTGPQGMGPMTGGGRGWCRRPGGGGGYGMGYGRGRGGRGFGRGARFGWGAGYAAPAPSPVVAQPQADTLDTLRAEAELTRNRLAEIEQRIALMETADDE